jgi:phosphate starvation-inducible protein PhoH and related proteins
VTKRVRKTKITNIELPQKPVTEIVDFGKYRKKNKNIMILPRNLSQEDYIELLEDKSKDIIFAIGPAGTGKSMIAVLAALRALRNGECEKIIITRPAVSVDEQHGFLPGTLLEKMAPWTRPIFDVIEEYYSPREILNMIEENIIEVAPLAFMRGRAEPLDNMIPTPNGYIFMKDIKHGDIIFGSDGNKIQVTGVFPQGKKDIYEVKFSDGSIVKCSGDHLWNTKTLSEKKHNKGFTTKTTLEILETLKTKNGSKNHEIPILTSPIQYNSIPIDIDPYLLGCILGDGNITHGSIGFSTSDQDIISLLSERIDEGYSIKYKSKYDYAITKDKGTQVDKTIKSKLEKLNLWGKKSYEKEIPDIYKFNSTDIRLEILQGLMDTDGSIFMHRSGKSRQQFYSTSNKLALDVKWIVESLGGVATIRTRVHKYEERKIQHKRPSFIVEFSLPESINPFKLSRKKDLYNPCRVKRLISEINYIGEEECQCISVSAEDMLYVTGINSVVTHNTFKNAYIIGDELQNSTPNQMKMLLTRIGENSRILITGDLAQHDRTYEQNGLKDFIAKLKENNSHRIGLVEFTHKDVERHPAVRDVLRIYGDE